MENSSNVPGSWLLQPPTTSNSTPTLLRVACEYGQIFSCASFVSAASSACGSVLSSTRILTDNPKPTEQDVRHWLEGNLCRCTGYHNIVEAVLYASETMSPKS